MVGLLRDGLAGSARDKAHQLFPFRLFFRQLFLALGGEFVIFGAAIRFRDFPFGGEPAAAFETVKGRVDRAVFDLQRVVRTDANGLADAVAMAGTPLECLEDKEIESSLQKR